MKTVADILNLSTGTLSNTYEHTPTARVGNRSLIKVENNAMDYYLLPIDSSKPALSLTLIKPLPMSTLLPTQIFKILF